MERLGITRLAKLPLHTLSGGQRQSVYVAMALAQDTPWILLDEPTAGQDLKHYTEIMDFLAELNAQGITVVLITHDNSIAVKAKRIVRLADGKIIYEADQTQSKLSQDISNDLKRRGMRFVGPVIIYSYLQAIGIINSHDPECFLHSND